MRGAVLLAFVVIVALASPAPASGEENDITLLTAPVWGVVANLSGQALLDALVPTGYNPSPEILLEPSGSVVFNNTYHVYLNVSVGDYWVVVAKVEILGAHGGRPPRGGVGGYAIRCGNACPRAGYWIEVIDVYSPGAYDVMLQGHYSREGGKWLYSIGYEIGAGKAVLFFGRVGEYVVGGMYGVPDSVYYYEDVVEAPIITAYGVRMRVYWVAVLEPTKGGVRIVRRLPETVRQGALLRHTGKYLLLSDPRVTYETVTTATTTVTRVLTATTVTTITYTNMVTTSAVSTEPCPATVSRGGDGSENLLLGVSVLTLVISVLVVVCLTKNNI